MLTVRDLRAGYGAGAVLRGVDLDVAPGQIVALLGRNGSGRSTLLRALMGQLPAPLHGTVSYRGQALAGLPGFAIARLGVAWVPEDRALFPGLTVEQNLLLGLLPGKAGAAAARLAGCYRRFPNLATRRRLPAGSLSGGEQQLLALARAWVADPALLLVDEPGEGLAPALLAQIGAFLRELRAEGRAILLVEQKLALALEVADRVCLLGHGQVVFSGSVAGFRARPELVEEWLQV